MKQSFKILVVDDIQDVRDTVAGVLTDAGHLAKTAGSELEAISSLADEEYDFIVIDIRLRGHEAEDESGLELARIIRKYNIESQIIFITGNSVKSRHFIPAREYNVLAYIEKTGNWVEKVQQTIKEARRDDVVVHFFTNAGFNIEPFGNSGFVCTTDRPLWRELPKVYVHLVLERALDLDEFQNLSQIAKEVFINESSKQIIFVIIDRLPEISDLHQIFALRGQRGFTIIPLPKELITSAIREEKESQYLLEQVSRFTGQTNHYDRDPGISDLLSFFGRHSLLENIKHSLVDGKSVIVFGVRKIGKTSLLARLRQETNWLITTITVQGYIDNLSYIYVDVIDAWQKELKTLYPNLDILDWAKKIGKITPSERGPIFRQAVKNFVELASNEKGFQGLFLFIDEMDLLVNQGEYLTFSAVLKSLIEDQYSKRRFALLMAGLDPGINRVDRIQGGRNPFYKFFQEYSVGPLSAEDTVIMVNALGGPMGITFEDDALQLLVSAGGCHPFLTRQLCSQSIQGKTRPLLVTLNQANKAIEDYLSDPENYMAETLWPVVMDGPPEPEARILKILAAKQPCIKDELIFQNGKVNDVRIQELALKHLSDQSIIRKNELDKWEITLPIFCKWIQRNILNMPSSPYANKK